jgi:hypothetical protein
MPINPLRRSLLPLLLLAAGATGGFAQSSDDSPFLPPAHAGGAAGAGRGPQAFELAGASITSNGTDVCIYDVQAKRSRWITVGSTSDQIQVVSYDPDKDQVVIRANGVQTSLELRKTTVESLGPAGQAAAFAMPAAPALTVNPSPPPVLPFKTPEVAKQEREARMLVSDLLEIGIQQRKAYEEAAKKAAANK